MIYLRHGEYHQIGKAFTPNIKTIAYALSHINRYTGHFGPYSVAQHCCHVASVLPDELKLSGLLHDACEAYIGDVASPLKRHIIGYQTLEESYLDTIDDFFEVSTGHKAVREADLRMLITEVKSFGGDIWDGHWPEVEPYDFTIERWPAEQAEKTFLQMFRGLVE